MYNVKGMKRYRLTYEEIENGIFKDGVRHIAQYQLSNEELRSIEKFGIDKKRAFENDIRTKLIYELKERIYE